LPLTPPSVSFSFPSIPLFNNQLFFFRRVRLPSASRLANFPSLEVGNPQVSSHYLAGLSSDAPPSPSGCLYPPRVFSSSTDNPFGPSRGRPFFGGAFLFLRRAGSMTFLISTLFGWGGALLPSSLSARPLHPPLLPHGTSLSMVFFSHGHRIFGRFNPPAKEPQLHPPSPR